MWKARDSWKVNCVFEVEERKEETIEHLYLHCLLLKHHSSALPGVLQRVLGAFSWEALGTGATPGPPRHMRVNPPAKRRSLKPCMLS